MVYLHPVHTAVYVTQVETVLLNVLSWVDTQSKYVFNYIKQNSFKQSHSGRNFMANSSEGLNSIFKITMIL